MNDTQFWTGRRVLVTGGTGFIGGRITRRLAELGASVVCLARGTTLPSERLIESQPLVVSQDVRDRAALECLLRTHDVDTVFHLAAQAIVGAATRDPVGAFEINVQGTWSLLEACRQVTSVKQVVTASSDKAYGDAKRLPYTEDTPLLGRHPYDTSKSCADMIARAYANTYGLNVAITRCGNFFGEGDPNTNRVVPGTIESLLRGERPVIRSDGKFVRDFLYVEDGVDAYVTLAEKLACDTSLRGEAFNFSAEEPMTVLELVERIAALVGSELEPVVLNEASNELRAQHLSAEKARRRLGWVARHSVNEGLAKTIAWYRMQRDDEAIGPSRRRSVAGSSVAGSELGASAATASS